MINIAAVIQRPADIPPFKARFEKAAQAVNAAFLDPKKGCYSIGRQGADVFPLAYGLVPQSMRRRVINHLIQHLETVTHRHFDTGILATPLLLRVLTDHGRADLALALMRQSTYPSYGWQIQQGATTLWENWNGMGSHIHPMFGSVCAWFFHDLAGIQPDRRIPGFRHVWIKPRPVKGISWVKAEHTGPFGLIQSAWSRHGDRLTLDITIPPSSSADIVLPGAANQAIRCNGKPLRSGSRGLSPGKRATADNGSVTLHAVSGRYRLVYTLRDKL
jgi:alpha-L-rhamnosidase